MEVAGESASTTAACSGEDWKAKERQMYEQTQVQEVLLSPKPAPAPVIMPMYQQQQPIQQEEWQAQAHAQIAMMPTQRLTVPLLPLVQPGVQAQIGTQPLQQAIVPLPQQDLVGVQSTAWGHLPNITLLTQLHRGRALMTLSCN